METPDEWEAEATRRFGPPEVRQQKNRRYVGRLLRKHSEEEIRGMLKALSKLKEPLCCANLAEHDLDAAPLHEIIQPYELLGLHFRVKSLSVTQVEVEVGEAYGAVGSGAKIVLQRNRVRSFRVVEQLGGWVA
jgi:hypothetical protein